MVANSAGLNENISSDARIRGLQMELETANSHLVLERERVRNHPWSETVAFTTTIVNSFFVQCTL